MLTADLEAHAQWHVKRFHPGFAVDATGLEARLVLRAHVDPSVISVVVLDRPGLAAGSDGLEVFSPERQDYAAAGSGGHSCATVFVGALLERMSGGPVGPD